MFFDWIEFLCLAQNLSGIPITPSDDAKLRSAISRAYYCLFNRAVEKAEAKWSYNPVFGDSSHQSLSRHLLRRQENMAKIIGKELDRLRPFRVEADYRTEVPNLLAKTHDVIKTVEKLIKWMEGV